MTREEEIKQTSYEVHKNILGTEEGEVAYATFIEGAKWADEHPKSPWISVEDRLPEIDPTQHTTKKNLSIPVLCADIDCLTDSLGMAYAPSLCRYDYERKDWLFVELGVYTNELEVSIFTHWMPIPELQKNE